MDTLFAIISLTLLFTLVYGPWQSACTDWARERLFACRDEIFDLAAKGEMDFDSASYRSLRRSIEGLIRFAHVLSWPRFLFTVAFSQPAKRPRSGSTDRALRQIKNLETRKKAQKQIVRAQQTVIFMMLMKSPVAIILCIVGTPLVLAAKAVKADGTNAAIERVRRKAVLRMEVEAASEDLPYAHAA